LAEKGQDIDLSEILSLDVANGLLEEGLINDEDYQQVVKILDATGSLKLTLEDLVHEDLLRQALGADKLEEYKKGISTAEESIDDLIEKILSG